MKKRIGTYSTQKIIGDSYQAYIPPQLPPNPPLNLTQLYPYLEKATQALGQLNGAITSIPNTTLFIYMYVRKEALLSSQIEGTQSSFSDLILFENDQKINVSLEDVEEVSNYVKSLYYGLEKLNNGFPLSLRLLREIHKILLSGTRGAGRYPGEFRKTQNWIGGTKPSNALFVPPPVENLDNCLKDLEQFLHDTSLPILIKIGLIHVQFETIHPFLDGNGRLGRLLIGLLLAEDKLLNEPVLYLSLYFKQQRNTYYNLLQEVRLHGTWETWLEFFLEGVSSASKQALSTIKEINTLFENDYTRIESLGRIRFSCIKIMDYLKKLPQVSVQLISKELVIAAPTARTALNALVTLEILEEISGKQRDKVYVYRAYLTILEKGTEPLKNS